MSKARAKRIKLLVLDVDGVLTDGKIYFVPAVPGGVQKSREAGLELTVSGDTLTEVKGFNAHDGSGISLAHLAGLQLAVITKRSSETVRVRCRDLHIDHVYQGINDKVAALHEILQKQGLTPEQAAYVGDDVIDLPAMRACGLAIAVANARPQVLKIAHYVTEHNGGEGAVRDAIDYILKVQGKLAAAIEAYISPEPAAKPAAPQPKAKRAGRGKAAKATRKKVRRGR